MKSSYPLPVISYLRLCNPSIVVLLTFTAVAAGISAGGLNHPWQLLSIGMAVTLCSMGARSLTNYVDRDMDAQMERTRNRPIPSGR
ncbi:MAG: UbiA family prenyltransferase, partial [Nitrososphaerota archaeon]|nr:UbiA family prenyltransferase [Nitrososphaerota archaeon]